jgi:hypothetical protein
MGFNTTEPIKVMLLEFDKNFPIKQTGDQASPGANQMTPDK